jgi:hypothetical protein
MRRIITLITVALSCWVASSATWAGLVPTTEVQPQVQVQAPAAQPSKKSAVLYPLALAAGAVAGVAAINTLTYGLGTLPYWIGAGDALAPVIPPASAAASRIFVITSAVLGAWIANTLYGAYGPP